MTLNQMVQNLADNGKPLNEAQIQGLKIFVEKELSKKPFYHENENSREPFYHEPEKSKLFLIEASIEDINCFIIHSNGNINHTWDESEANVFGMMLWFVSNEPNIMLAYY